MENQVLNEKNYNINETEKKLNILVNELKNNINKSDFKSITWWKNTPKSERLNPGDIVFIKDANKYGVVCGPARKKDLIKVILLKKSISKGYYNREWYINKDNLQLVRKNSRFQKGFIAAYDKFYQIQQ